MMESLSRSLRDRLLAAGGKCVGSLRIYAGCLWVSKAAVKLSSRGDGSIEWPRIRISIYPELPNIPIVHGEGNCVFRCSCSSVSVRSYLSDDIGAKLTHQPQRQEASLTAAPTFINLSSSTISRRAHTTTPQHCASPLNLRASRDSLLQDFALS